MNHPVRISGDGKYLDVHVPMTFRSIGGRKLMIAPDGEPVVPETAAPVIDSPLLQALVHAFSWREMLESGEYACPRDLAESLHIDGSWVNRTLRLTLLAPDIVEMIVDNRQPGHMTLSALRKPFPRCWKEQRRKFGL